MKGRSFQAMIGIFLGLIATISPARAGEPRGTDLLQKLIDSEQLTETKELGDLLAEYGLTESHVRKLIEAAEATTSDARRNLLWHSILEEMVSDLQQAAESDPSPEVSKAARNLLEELKRDPRNRLRARNDKDNGK